MKRSLFFYYFSLTASVILAIFGILAIDSHASVYDATTISAPISTISLENVNKSTPKIAENYTKTPTFSTANVVKSAVTTFTAPVIEVKDMNYTDYSGISHLGDSYAIMHYAVSSNNFYYAHNTGGFAPLSSLKLGDQFVIGNKNYIVRRIDFLTFADTATSMRQIMTSDNHTYAASFMTCAGSMGYFTNNSGRVDYTASHRLIIYADRA